jgi:hypothetical protein
MPVIFRDWLRYSMNWCKSLFYDQGAAWSEGHHYNSQISHSIIIIDAKEHLKARLLHHRRQCSVFNIMRSIGFKISLRLTWAKRI